MGLIGGEQLLALLAELGEDPGRRHGMEPHERAALANLTRGLESVRVEAPKREVHAPRADGAAFTGDRPLGGTPAGWTEVPR